MQSNPHSAGPDHYWAKFRDGRIELVSKALRQCEVGAIEGDGVLCVLDHRTPYDRDCRACVQRRARKKYAADNKEMLTRLRAAVVDVQHTGAVYLVPTTDGNAPAGYTATFGARGTIAEVGSAYADWQRSGDRYYRRTGRTYPRRILRGFSLWEQICRKLQEEFPGQYIASDVRNLLQEVGV